MTPIKRLSKKILIAVLLLGMFLLSLFIFNLSPKREKPPFPLPSPTVKPTPTVTLFPTPTLEPTPKKEVFKLIATNPDFTNPDYLYPPSLEITLTFNQPLDLNNFSYSLIPEVKITPRLSGEGKQIILNNEGPWPEGSFTLVILKRTTFLTGERLERDYLYRFRVGFYPGGAD